MLQMANGNNWLPFNKEISRVLGSPLYAIVLSYIAQRHTYFEERGALIDGFFICFLGEIARETTITNRRAIERALDLFCDSGLLQKKVIGCPPKMWLRVTDEADVILAQMIQDYKRRSPEAKPKGKDGKTVGVPQTAAEVAQPAIEDAEIFETIEVVAEVAQPAIEVVEAVTVSEAVAVQPKKRAVAVKPAIPTKKPYGEFGRVLLTEVEHGKLLAKYGGTKLAWCIERLDSYMESKGVAYKSCYAVFSAWVSGAYDEHASKQSRIGYGGYQATPKPKYNDVGQKYEGFHDNDFSAFLQPNADIDALLGFKVAAK